MTLGGFSDSLSILPPVKNTFLDKLLNRIDRVGQGDLQAYLQRLNNEKGFFETIFNTLQEGIVVVDAKGRILYFNHAITSLLGLDPARGHGHADRAAPEGARLAENPGRGPRGESRPGGLLSPAALPQFLSRPVGGQGRVPHGLRHYFPRPDRAARAQAREAIESEKLNAVTLLAAGVAHELGNPLNSLNIHLQLLERDLKQRGDNGSDEDLLESVRVARSEVGRLDTIISQFLGAVRPAHTVRAMVSINSVVRESLAFSCNRRSRTAT